MNRRNAVIGVAFLLIGLAVLLGTGTLILRTLGATLSVIGGLIIHTSLIPGRPAALLRIDWFLPALRKDKADRPPRPIGWLATVAGFVLPKSLFS